MSDKAPPASPPASAPAPPPASPPPASQALGAHHLIAAATDAGTRVDRFLAERLEGLSRSRIKALMLEGKVWRDGATLADPSEPVRAGAAYALVIPPPRPAWPQGEAIPLAILFEDRDLIVLDKPPGLVVHPAPGNEAGTLVNALIGHCGPDLAVGGEHRPGIVHRLDKDTSGVLVAAKTEAAMAALSAAFAAREPDRAYLALVWGVPAPAQGEIEGAIGRDPRDRKRMALRLHGGGKPALTRYRTLRVWGGPGGIAVALLECRLATGRTHQIRVHLASRGHPVVGDPVYLRRVPGAAAALPDALRRRLLDFPRQALHAARLGFAHPRTGAPLAFETPPPPDMAALIAALDCAGRGP